jgi:hypothetical protein
MVTKATNVHKCIKLSYTINIVCLLHVSAPLVAVSREMDYKRQTHQEITNVCEPTHRRNILNFNNIWLKIHTYNVKYRQNFVIIQECNQSSM